MPAFIETGWYLSAVGHHKLTSVRGLRIEGKRRRAKCVSMCRSGSCHCKRLISLTGFISGEEASWYYLHRREGDLANSIIKKQGISPTVLNVVGADQFCGAEVDSWVLKTQISQDLCCSLNSPWTLTTFKQHTAADQPCQLKVRWTLSSWRQNIKLKLQYTWQFKK